MEQLEEDIRYLHKIKNRLEVTEGNPNQLKTAAIDSAYSAISLSIKNLERLKDFYREEV